MANNRYFLYCECGKAKMMGKSLGEGIYNTASIRRELMTPEQAMSDPFVEDPNQAQADFLEELYEWMWEHMQHKEAPKGLTPEWFGGEAFKVLTEYDDRIDYSNKEMFK